MGALWMKYKLLLAGLGALLVGGLVTLGATHPAGTLEGCECYRPDHHSHPHGATERDPGTDGHPHPDPHCHAHTDTDALGGTKTVNDSVHPTHGSAEWPE